LGDDRLDDVGLRIGVVLDVGPVLGRQFALRPLIQVTILVVAPEPVAERQDPLDLGAAGRKNVHVDVRVGALQDTMLVPVWLANDELVAGRFKRRKVSCFVGRVAEHQEHVNDRFRSEGLHGRRPRVLEPNDGRAKRAADPFILPLEQLGPGWVVLDKGDCTIEARRLDHPRRSDLLLGHRNVLWCRFLIRHGAEFG